MASDEVEVMSDLKDNGFTGYIVSSENFYHIITNDANDLIHIQNNLSQLYGVDLEHIEVVRVRVEFLKDDE